MFRLTYGFLYVIIVTVLGSFCTMGSLGDCNAMDIMMVKIILVMRIYGICYIDCAIYNNYITPHPPTPKPAQPKTSNAGN